MAERASGETKSGGMRWPCMGHRVAPGILLSSPNLILGTPNVSSPPSNRQGHAVWMQELPRRPGRGSSETAQH
jgi:hypothetical protein